MFRITRLTDYGVLLMAQLARNMGEVHNAAELAATVCLPQPTVSKILQILLHQGLLKSVRGAGGGYRLAKAPSEISVREIIAGLEGPIAITECNLEEGNCEQEPHCTTRANWQLINQAMRQALDEISLADMLRSEFVAVFHVQKYRSDPGAEKT